MDDVVADSSPLVAYFLAYDAFHQPAREFIAELDSAGKRLHLPTIVMVETISAIRRRLGQDSLSALSSASATINAWEGQGKVIFCPLSRERMEVASRLAEELALRGADSVIAALSEELGIELKTYDNEILHRFQRSI